MSNTKINAQEFVDEGYQGLVDNRACSVYWDQFHVESIHVFEGDYLIEYGGMHHCVTSKHTRLTVRWHSEQDYLAYELRKTEKALEEARETLRFIHDMAQGARNSIGGSQSASEDVVLALENIDTRAFAQYVRIGKVGK